MIFNNPFFNSEKLSYNSHCYVLEYTEDPIALVLLVSLPFLFVFVLCLSVLMDVSHSVCPSSGAVPVVSHELQSVFGDSVWKFKRLSSANCDRYF